MKHICAWCQAEISIQTNEISEKDISHGICENCKIDLEYKRIKLDDFLNKIPFPVLAVDVEGNVSLMNQQAEQSLQKTNENYKGKPGGDIMECMYSFLPDGCGNTIHCTACTIRNTVMKTHETGQEQQNVVAYQYLKTTDGNQKFEILISTLKIGEVVVVKIKKMTPIDGE